MKNFCLWIVAVMVCFGILPAQAQDSEAANIKFTVNVPNADAVKCTVNGDEHPLTAGANAFDVPQYANIYFTGNAPWKLDGVTDRNGTAVSGFYGDAWYLTALPEMQDQEYTLAVINLDEYRTASCTVIVDDPSLVNAMLGGYYTGLTLKAGENTVKYDPAIETYINISPVNYNVPLYSVKFNGTEVAPQSNSYSITLSDGCVIDITAILPDEDRTVSFSYSEGAEGSISVLVNEREAADFNGKSLTVKLGDQMKIVGNVTDFKFNEVKVNGEPVSFYGSYVFSVMKDSEVYIDAEAYGSIKATIVVSDPELITVYRGFSYNGDVMALQPGENVVELQENNSVVSWEVSSNGILNAVLINGDPVSSYETYRALEDGDVLVFDIVEKVYDKKAVTWIDNVAAPACSIYLELASPTDNSARFTLEDGYNMLFFYDQMNPFYLSWYGSSEEEENVSLKGKVYLNGELLAPMYENSTAYSFDLEDGDVLKLFMESAPVECKVAFDIAEGVEASVVKDVITAVENPAEGFDCFAGTQVVVSGSDIEVKVNGSAIEGEKNEDGAEDFTFTVNDAATTVSVTAAGGSAVKAIAEDADADVFNMQGVRVGSKSSLRSLAPGIYIVAGKKVVVAE